MRHETMRDKVRRNTVGGRRENSGVAASTEMSGQIVLEKGVPVGCGVDDDTEYCVRISGLG